MFTFIFSGEGLEYEERDVELQDQAVEFVRGVDYRVVRVWTAACCVVGKDLRACVSGPVSEIQSNFCHARSYPCSVMSLLSAGRVSRRMDLLKRAGIEA